MNSYRSELISRIYQAREKASQFFNQVIFNDSVGWLYTATHDVNRYPAAVLYGTWAGILGLHLIQDTEAWTEDKKAWALSKLEFHRRNDGSFFPLSLEGATLSKSIEYLKLHCTNYALGAALEINPDYDYETSYLDRFLDGDYLGYWLEGRSLQRPWEEGNNIVNVCSYLALMNDKGNPVAQARLSQMLDWHRRHQNIKTGGFDSFISPSFNQHLETLAGAVHNFHLHSYLGESYGFENLIVDWVERFLYQGNLSACLSIDFVELAIHTIQFSKKPQGIVNALIYHLEELLTTQRDDGGWAENSDSSPTTAAGFSDIRVSSCSYAAWFKLASIGMISICLLGDNPNKWHFRKTLGMGYAKGELPDLSQSFTVAPISLVDQLEIVRSGIPRKLKSSLIKVGAKLVK